MTEGSRKLNDGGWEFNKIVSYSHVIPVPDHYQRSMTPYMTEANRKHNDRDGKLI